MSFFEELKRRNVFRVGIAYVLLGWVVLQAADFALDLIDAPNWIIQAMFIIGLAGLPIALFFSWAFEITPEGIKREEDVDRSQSMTSATGRRLDRAVIVLLVLAVVALLLDRQLGTRTSIPEPATAAATTESEPSKSESTTSPAPSIAVLPYRDMSANQDQAYFGEGIAEELLNGLVKLEGIEVASRTSTFALAAEDLPIPQLAERLDVAHVLEGSVRTSGNAVRVTAQLIEVSTDKHLWSDTFDGSLDDIFRIQDEITTQILDELQIQLAGADPASAADALTDNAEAYRLYLQGRALWRQRTASGLNAAIEMFLEAVDLDPNFHQAWSNLAVAYSNLPEYDLSADWAESIAASEAAADRALAIDPGATEALAVKAQSAELSCDFVEATRLLQAAIASNPREPTPHHWYANQLQWLGHTARAREEIDRAFELDPLISAVVAVSALLHVTTGEFDKALTQARDAQRLGHEIARTVEQYALYFRGDITEMAQESRDGLLT